MNSIAKRLAVCAGMLSPFIAGQAAGATPVAEAVMLVQAAAVTQVGAEADRSALLRQARAAIEQGRFDEAEHWIRRAEQAPASFNINPMADTPKKAREALEEARGHVARPSQGLLPSIATPFSRDRQEEGQADPFARQGANIDQMLEDKKSRAVHFLAQGRKALDEGSLTTARHFHQRALEFGATFSADEDSPDKLLADIQERRVGATGAIPRRLPDGNEIPNYTTAMQATGTGERYAEHQSTEAPPRGVAGRELLYRSRRALAAGDVRRARELSEQAARLESAFDPLDDTPEKIAELIQRHEALQARAAEGGNPEALRRQQADLLIEQSQSLLRWWSDYDTAEQLAIEADRLGLVYSQFQINPRMLLERIESERAAARNSRAALAGGEVEDRHGGSRALYQPDQDRSRTELAGQREPAGPAGVRFSSGELETDEVAARQPEAPDLSAPAEPATAPAREPIARYATNQAEELMELGERALRTDPARAMEYFQEASKYQSDLDPARQQRLQSVLRLGQMSAEAGVRPRRLVDEVAGEETALQRQMLDELGREYREAEKLKETNPREALDLLVRGRGRIEASALSGQDKTTLLGRRDREIAMMEQYLERNRSQIELDESNRAVREDINRRRDQQVVVENKLAEMVEEYNRLRDEQRLHEAEVIAKKAYEMAPDEPVAMLMYRESRFRRRVLNNQAMRDEKEAAVIDTLASVERASIPFDDSNPIRFTDALEWEALTRNRRRFTEDIDRKRHPAEIEIEQKLRTPVSLSFREAPLAEVIDHLKHVSGVNVHLDIKSLEQEGLFATTPVTIDLPHEISLRSALNLILQPLRLSYVIQDEVLKITSEQIRDGAVYTKTYPVADLVIPIPDFIPHNRMGLAGALADGYEQTYRTSPGFQPPMMSLAANQSQGHGGMVPRTALGQTSPMGFTTGGSGGASRADFDALIELMTKTVDPATWDEVGGPGSIIEFEGNLSLVISQTQEVHEKIADLLAQLRRLQDLQVTIEVRFITLSDNFFERIGIDFDFNIPQNLGDIGGTSATVGFSDASEDDPFPNFNPGGDIQFRNNSFAGAVPQFGGFDPATAATFGVAILSDIEAFFLVQAAQGDQRSNIMQAPKVTLFNGQTASISDTSQTPFVTSVTPVVGDFAAAQAPVIVVLNEGTTLSVQAVVSSDRRFVRLTLVPFFSQITDVDTFTFTGRTTSTSEESDEQDNQGDSTSSSRSQSNFTEGTTIQLPTFSFTTVTTTVSVPDGGTVLLGGIKRLREGRTELGVPFLSKMPYISRLFKNVGIGRETQSLMLMVTPRIIIQEEEEERLGIAVP